MRAALLAGRWLYLLVLWLTLASAAGAGSLEIRAARAVVSVQALTTTANVTLPYHWDREHRSHPGSAQFDMAFTMPEVSLQQLGEPFGIYFARIGNTADVWLNGTLLARLGDTAIADADDFSKSPQYVSIPPQLLMQQNLLTIHLHADGGRRGGLSRVVLGPESEVLPLFRTAYNWRVSVSLAVAILSLLMGGIAMVLWLSQTDPGLLAVRRDTLYLSAGVAELCWALRVGDVAIEHPLLAWPWWSVVVTGAFAGWICCIALFCHHVAGWHLHRSMPLFRGFMAALFASSLLASFLSMQWAQPVFLTTWLGFANAFFIAYAAVYFWTALRQRDSARLLLAVAGAINVAMGVRDWLVIRISGDLGESTWIRYSSVLFGLVLGYIAISRFRAASAQARDLRAHLEERVLRKEVELQHSYQKVEALGREQARVGERARILRDMHDGVGSHISAAIRQLESGKATSGEVLLTLRDSLDHLKLTIDSMHLPAGDITALLANLRYRLEPRFAASDIELQWDVDLIDPVVRLDGGAMRQLQFMVFEALSNVLQHAQASVLRIEAHPAAGGALLRIIDNGRGFDPAIPFRKGLQSMHERAAAIGAQLRVTSGPGGTQVEVRLE
ncbi:MAG: histidine kinase [Burkholderiaceae bacterium]|nr:histidine kinase [Burkholderiaceae bacterium]